MKAAALTLATATISFWGQQPERFAEQKDPEPVIQQVVDEEGSLQAVISGIKPNQHYQEAPPAMIELSHLPNGAEIWVEVRSASREWSRTIAAKGHFIPRADGEALLPVPDLARICDHDGQFTVIVFTNGPANSAVALSRTSFFLKRPKALAAVH